MSADQINELILRLEASQRPNIELGREILLACGWRRTCVGHFYGPLYRWSSPDFKYGDDEDRLACPTESLDMAVKLVPPHHLWQVRQGFEASAVVWMIETDYDDREPPTGHTTKFPALALCIAALKATAEQIAPTESASTHDVSGGTK